MPANYARPIFAKTSLELLASVGHRIGKYLCIRSGFRTLLTKFKQMRLFNTYLSDEGHDRPEEAQIALAGCKFLDLLCTLETDAFQMFVVLFNRAMVAGI